MTGENRQDEQSPRSGRERLPRASEPEDRSVFTFSLFIEQAFQGAERESTLLDPPAKADGSSWRDAIGRRKLTDAEQATRERHFRQQAEQAIRAARRNESHQAATDNTLRKVLARMRQGS